MALARFVVTAAVTVPAGTFTKDSTPWGTGSWAGAGAPAAWAAGVPVSFARGQVLQLDTATTAGAALQSAIGAGNLRAYVPGQDDAGHVGLSN